MKLPTQRDTSALRSSRCLLEIERDSRRITFLGTSDRYTMLSPKLLEILRSWWRVEKPKDWLFPGDFPGQHITRSAVESECRIAQRISKIPKPITPHSLRHAFAVHLLEQGTDIRHIQLLLGHRSLATTAKYLRIATSKVCSTSSPLDLLPRPVSVRHTSIAVMTRRCPLVHPHLHCVVPGGGISLDGARWISCCPRFFLPVRVLSRLFRRLFLQYLQQAFDAGKLQFFSSLQALQDPQAFTRHLDLVREAEWVVYAKPPFAGPQQVVDYVGRYTHRVAISNHRIVDIEDDQVKFTWRDYRDNNQQKTMPLTADEFIGRFLLHVLPRGFHRIRYYGFLGNPHRKEKLERCRQLLGMAPRKENSAEPAPREDYRDRYERLTGRSLRECPVCHRGRMIAVKVLPQVRSSPTIRDTS